METNLNTKELNEVIHFYLGHQCMVFTKFESPILLALTLETLTNYFITPEQELHKIIGISPILRPLSDMTQEETATAANLSGLVALGITDVKQGKNLILKEAVHIAYLLKQGFDLFGLIEAGQAIDKTKLKIK